MNMIGMVQNFIGQMTEVVNDRANPLGLSKGQIDEINQILQLIKNIISDGIQRGDISKMVTLMGEMIEHMPEMQAEIKELIDGLKDLSKKLFDDNDAIVPKEMSFKDALMAVLKLEKAEDQTIGGGQPVMRSLMDQVVNTVQTDDETILKMKEADEQRLELAENILNFVNEQIILSDKNVAAISEVFKKLNRRAQLAEPADQAAPPVDDLTIR